jgi:hypothetical protein
MGFEEIDCELRMVDEPVWWFYHSITIALNSVFSNSNYCNKSLNLN